MRKQYANPEILVFKMAEKEDILLKSDVDIDVNSLYDAGPSALLD